MSSTIQTATNYRIQSPYRETGGVLQILSGTAGRVGLGRDTKDDLQQWVLWASDTTSGYRIENYKFDTFYVTVSTVGTNASLQISQQPRDWYFMETTAPYFKCVIRLYQALQLMSTRYTSYNQQVQTTSCGLSLLQDRLFPTRRATPLHLRRRLAR